MKKVLTLGLATLTTLTAFAGSGEDLAKIIAVQERYVQSNSRQVCNREPQMVPQSAQPGANGFGVGTAIGALAGGLLGSQVGKGNGKVAAAATGAVTGALSGQYIENSRNSPQPEQVCQMVPGEMAVDGYTVTYEYAGRQYTDVMPYKPHGGMMRVFLNISPAQGQMPWQGQFQGQGQYQGYR